MAILTVENAFIIISKIVYVSLVGESIASSAITNKTFNEFKEHLMFLKGVGRVQYTGSMVLKTLQVDYKKCNLYWIKIC